MNQIFNANHHNTHLYLQSFIEKTPPQTSESHMSIYAKNKKETTPRENKQLSTDTQNADGRVKDHHAQSLTTKTLLGKMRQPGVGRKPSHAKSLVLNPPKLRSSSEVCLAWHREYLLKRLQETQYTISGPKLLKEIPARGYRGSHSNLQGFIAIVRKDTSPSEARLAFHQDYIIKRLEETRHTISGSQLFKEIQAKGYRGVVKSVTNFLSMLRKDQTPSEAHLAFHQDYLIKRMEKAQPQSVAASTLFREIQDRGYRGSFETFRRSMTEIRRKLLFKQIPTEGYRSSIKVVQNSMTSVHKNKYPLKTRLSFHKNYLTERIEEEGSKIPRLQLFREIQARGYRGSIHSIKQFVAAIRRDKRPPEYDLCFHKDYLIKRIEGAFPNYIPTAELLQEVRNKGYRGSYGYLRNYVSRIRKHKSYVDGILRSKECHKSKN